MIDRQILNDTIDSTIAGTDIFIVDVKVTPDNVITVELDSPEGMDIDTCAEITRKINDALDRDVEDYSLEVGSAGLTAPFKVKGQWLKNIGNEIEVLTRDGKKFHGTLVEVTDDGFTAEVAVKERQEGKKRPVTVMKPVTMAFDAVKQAKYMIQFK